ncbi:MAG: hypothetical protein PHF12_00175 [Candidatus Omnitrophica bacterium]|nr:hypothetical protein [Candidatus Omnitrophota bacterium]
MAHELDMADIEERALEIAEELAEKQYGLSFDALPPQLQMRVWTDAEQEIINELALRAELVCGDRETFWDELELERRQGN